MRHKKHRQIRHDDDPDAFYDRTLMAEMLDNEDEDGSWELPKIALTLELKDALKKGVSREEIRFMVDTLYQRQRARIRTTNQIKARERGQDTVQTRAMMMEWLVKHDKAMEEQIATAMRIFIAGHPLYGWLSSIKGVGPLLASGLVAYLDIDYAKVKAAGSFWSFAGLNPEQKWLPGQKRPWNASLKCLCYKLGESFVKQQGKEDAFYSDHFTERKIQEVRWNDEGKNAAWATTEAVTGHYANTTEAWKWVNACYPAGTSQALQDISARVTAEFEAEILRGDITPKTAAQKAAWLSARIQEARAAHLAKELLPPGQGLAMLPPAHIHARARRWVVKMFLSHMYDVWYEIRHGVRPPDPWVIAHGGHVHKIDPPRLDLERKKKGRVA